MADKIGIMGSGALGSYVAAFLAKEGEDVTIVDMWPEHVNTINEKGLHVTGSQGPFTVPIKAMHLTDAQSIYDKFEGDPLLRIPKLVVTFLVVQHF